MALRPIGLGKLAAHERAQREHPTKFPHKPQVALTVAAETQLTELAQRHGLPKCAIVSLLIAQAHSELEP